MRRWTAEAAAAGDARCGCGRAELSLARPGKGLRSHVRAKAGRLRRSERGICSSEPWQGGGGGSGGRGGGSRERGLLVRRGEGSQQALPNAARRTSDIAAARSLPLRARLSLAAQRVARAKRQARAWCETPSMSAALQLPPTPEDFERVELVLRSLKAIKAATYDVVLLAFGGFPPQAQQHTSYITQSRPQATHTARHTYHT